MASRAHRCPCDSGSSQKQLRVRSDGLFLHSQRYEQRSGRQCSSAPVGPPESQQARRDAKKQRRTALLQKRKQDAAWHAATQRAGHWYEVSVSPGARPMGRYLTMRLQPRSDVPGAAVRGYPMHWHEASWAGHEMKSPSGGRSRSGSRLGGGKPVDGLR